MDKMQALKCDLCNGSLIIDDSREFAVCEFCGTKYMANTLRKSIQKIKGTVEVVPGENTKEKIKNDIKAFIAIDNLFKALLLLTDYTDTYPSDPAGYFLKLDFICTQGCTTRIESFRKHHLDNPEAFLYHQAYFYGSKYVFLDFRDNLSILNKLTSTSYTNKYAKLLLDLIKSGTTLFRFDGQFDCSSFSDPQYRNPYIQKALDALKTELIETLGGEIGLSAFDEGVANAREYGKLCEYDNQPINFYSTDCFFLLGNQILSIGGNNDIGYKLEFFTLSHIPNIQELKKIKQKNDIINYQKKIYQKNNLCQYCGGSFKGIFKKICTKCGELKDY